MDVDESSQCSDSDESNVPYKVTNEVWMVPCTVDTKVREFVPTVQPSATSLEQRPERQAWMQWEDDMLRAIIVAEGTKHWTSIAKCLNDRVHNSMPLRHGKQCRERWYNHLDPNLRKGNWTREEDLCLLEKQVELGNHWSEISKLLVGRNENSVKNRFNSLMRRAKKELPAGTDPIRWLIAEMREEELEMTDGTTVQLISPMLNSAAFDNLRQCQQTGGNLGIPPIQICAIDSVKRGLRSIENPQEFGWMQGRSDRESKEGFSPSLFFA